MRDHERIEELLTLEALGALEAGEAEELRAALADHGEDCGECARLRAEIAETAGLLPLSLDPVPVPAGLDALPAEAVSPAVGSAPPRRPRRSVALLVAAALVGVAIGVAIGVNVGGNDTETTPTLATLLAQPGTTVVPLQGDTGNVIVAVAADGSQSYLAGNGLQPLPEGKVYELWSIAGNTPRSLACTASTDGSVRAPVATSVQGADILAITVEDASCPSAPTTTPILTGNLS